jgi:phosphatidylserine/phosphatidylglycerophosphate/cardiolipin synthase-like enzyme
MSFPTDARKAAYFNGQSFLIVHSTQSWPEDQTGRFSGGITVCLWVRPSHLPLSGTATFWSYGDHDGFLNVGVMDKGQLSVQSGNHDVYLPNINLANKHWHHLAVSLSRRSSDYQVTVYFDGASVGQSTQRDVPMSGLRLALGENFTGEMCLFSIWNEALTLEGIQQVMSQHVDRNDQNLALYWPLDEAPFEAMSDQVTFNVIGEILVEFLLDGKAFFQKFKELLIKLKNASGPIYYPMNEPAQPTFGNLIVEAGAAGQKVDIISWNMEKIAQVIAGSAAIMEFLSDPEIPSEYRKTQVILDGRAGEHKGNVRVFPEEYFVNSAMQRTGTTASSQHQKFAIFCFDQEKYALVGGLNLHSQYWDDPAHPMSDDWTDPDHPLSKYKYHSWHDTAVFLKGAAVNTIEQEFDRRWKKSNYTPLPAAQANYAKLGFWSTDPDACFDPDICVGKQAPGVVYVDPAVFSKSYQNLSVTALRTNFEAAQITEIQDALIQCIQSATRYIYFENFTFHSPKLLLALAQKSAQVPLLKIIIMVPDYSVQNKQAVNPLKTLDDAQSFFTRCAFLSLAIPYAGQVVIEDGDIATRSLSEVWQVNLNENGLEFSTFTYKKPNAAQRTVPLYKVRSLDDLTREVYLCAPYRRQGGILRSIYVHSKLALFDDEALIIGSANFNQRSMQTDGELSLLIEGQEFVQETRGRLFNHWSMGSPDNWRDRMSQFSSRTDDAVGVLPLDIRDMNHTWPDAKWYYLSYLDYSSRWA